MDRIFTMTFCPSFPNQILPGCRWDVNIGLSYFASHGRNNNSGKKKKNTSTICHSLWSCVSVSLEWSWRTNSKLKLDQKTSSRVTVKMNQNQTKWEAFWNGKGRVTSQKFESEDLYCYIAYLTICTKNYRRSDASLSLTFSQGFHIKVKPQGSALTSTFTFPKIFHDGFYAKEGLQNKLKVKLKKLGVY